MSRELALSCKNLSKRFTAGDSEIYAVRGATLDVYRGEFLLLVGPSGCGKTTLISIFAGILSFNEGSCTVLGQDYSALKPRDMLDFRAHNLGFIFQSFNLLPSLTSAENVAIPLIIQGVSQSQALERAHAMLHEVGLEGRGNDKPDRLSGGQQQRVAIARALVHEPKLLVCDEPTSALDHDTGHKIMDVMYQMQRKLGTTVIVVTHDNRIFSYADRMAIMEDGAVIRIETPSATSSPTAQAHV